VDDTRRGSSGLSVSCQQSTLLRARSIAASSLAACSEHSENPAARGRRSNLGFLDMFESEKGKLISAMRIHRGRTGSTSAGSLNNSGSTSLGSASSARDLSDAESSLSRCRLRRSFVLSLEFPCFLLISCFRLRCFCCFYRPSFMPPSGGRQPDSS
jgi:hypothetical protein